MENPYINVIANDSEAISFGIAAADGGLAMTLKLRVADEKIWR